MNGTLSKWVKNKWAYVSTAKPVFVILGIGYLCMIFSMYYEWKVPASGAVLVCAALLSELLSSHLPWSWSIRFFPEFCVLERTENNGYIRLRKDLDGYSKLPRTEDGYTILEGVTSYDGVI